MTREDFSRKFADERACQDYVFGLRWPSGFACATCAATRYYWHRHRALVECAGCGTQVYIRARTLFEGSHLPLLKWFQAARLVATTPCGVCDVQSELRLKSYGTAFTVLRRLRSCMRLPERRPLPGPVELRAGTLRASDRSNKWGAAAIGMVAGVQRKELRVGPLPGIGPTDVTAFVVANVQSGSTVYTATEGVEYRGVAAAGFQAVCVFKRPRRDGGSTCAALDDAWGELEYTLRGVRTDTSPFLRAFELRRNATRLSRSVFETILRNALGPAAPESS